MRNETKKPPGFEVALCVVELMYYQKPVKLVLRSAAV